MGAPDFLPGLINRRYEVLKHKGKSRLIDFSRDGRLMTRGEIEGEVTEDLDYFRFMQLGAYIRSKIKTFPVIRELTSFERNCLNGESMRHSLSHFYEILTSLEAPQELNFMQAWERELGVTFTQKQKAKMLKSIHKTSIASRYQEGGYKILTRWYRTPSALQKIFPQVSDRCWRCKRGEGTMLHIFWECEEIKSFWGMVEETIKDITGVSLGSNPAAFLLNDVPLSVEKYRNSLLKHLLTAAKACIPALWKSTVPPTKFQWWARITEIQQMENLTMMLKEQDEKYRKIWSPLVEYRIREQEKGAR